MVKVSIASRQFSVFDRYAAFFFFLFSFLFQLLPSLSGVCVIVMNFTFAIACQPGLHVEKNFKNMEQKKEKNRKRKKVVARRWLIMQ